VCAGDDTLTLWDLAVEIDDEESRNTAGVQDVPPQLLFVHYMEQIKEAHWHPQMPGTIMATGGSGFGYVSAFSFLLSPRRMLTCDAVFSRQSACNRLQETATTKKDISLRCCIMHITHCSVPFRSFHSVFVIIHGPHTCPLDRSCLKITLKNEWV
jgi:hypothetical protein